MKKNKNPDIIITSKPEGKTLVITIKSTNKEVIK